MREISRTSHERNLIRLLRENPMLALETLELERIDVIYPGDRVYRLHERIRAVPLATLANEILPM